MKKKTNWDELPIMCWKLTLYKENDKGKMKFYEYTGDHSFVSEGMENEYLSEIIESNFSIHILLSVTKAGTFVINELVR